MSDFLLLSSGVGLCCSFFSSRSSWWWFLVTVFRADSNVATGEHGVCVGFLVRPATSKGFLV